MSKIHPFPGVRILPTDYRRFLVEQRRIQVTTGEVFARSYEDAAALVAAGKVNNVRRGLETPAPTITADPAEAGEGNHDEDQPHIHD